MSKCGISSRASFLWNSSSITHYCIKFTSKSSSTAENRIQGCIHIWNPLRVGCNIYIRIGNEVICDISLEQWSTTSSCKLDAISLWCDYDMGGDLIRMFQLLSAVSSKVLAQSTKILTPLQNTAWVKCSLNVRKKLRMEMELKHQKWLKSSGVLLTYQINFCRIIVMSTRNIREVVGKSAESPG